MKRFFRINQYIQAKEIRVISEEGKQIGVMDLAKALEEARNEGKDLVEIAPLAKPPVCKIIDFKKFRYQQAKKEGDSRKKGKQDIKEIRLSPFIAANDLQTRIKKGREFIKKTGGLKVTVRFKGREITKKEFGYNLLSKVVQQFEDIAKVEKLPAFQGKDLMMFFKKK